MRRFFVVEVRADVADVRVGEADDLAGITGVGEDFLIAGEAGVENNFAAAAAASAGGAAVKDAPVFERECSGRRGQRCLPKLSLPIVGKGRDGADAVHRPVDEDGFAVDERNRHGAEDARIVGARAVIAHDEVVVCGDQHGAEAVGIRELRADVRLDEALRSEERRVGKECRL